MNVYRPKAIDNQNVLDYNKDTSKTFWFRSLVQNEGSSSYASHHQRYCQTNR